MAFYRGLTEEALAPWLPQDVFSIPIPTLVTLYFAAGGSKRDPFKPDASKGEYAINVTSREQFRALMEQQRARKVARQKKERG